MASRRRPRVAQPAEGQPQGSAAASAQPDAAGATAAPENPAPWAAPLELLMVGALALCSFANATEGGWAIDDPRSFSGNRDVVGQLVAPPTGAETLEAAAAGQGAAGAEPAQGDNGSVNPYLPSSGVAVGGEVPEGGYLKQLPLAQLWRDDFWGEPMASANSHKSYRPLAVLSFRLSYWLWGAALTGGGLGEASQRAYHAENVAMHALVSVLLLLAVRRAAPRQPRSVGLGAALLFGCHAVHCEAVANVTGRAELLAAGLFLASFLAYPTNADGSIHWFRLLGSVCLGVMAMLAKEPGVTVLGLSLMVDGAAALDLMQQRRGKAAAGVKVRAAVTRVIVRALVVACLGGGALASRWSLNKGQAPRFSDSANPAALTAPDSTTRWLTHAYVWVQSYWLLICPLRLSVDWGHSSIALITAWGDERNLVTAIGFALALIAVWWSLTRLPHALTAAWVGMLFLPFLPASNIFFTVGFVIADRVMYLPSVGFCVLAALLCLGDTDAPPAAGDRKNKTMSAAKASSWSVRSVVFGCLVMANTLRTWARNEDWRDCHALWSSSSSALPTNEFLPVGLGECLLEKYTPEGNDGDLARKEASIHGAMDAYRVALKINPTFGMATVALAKLLHLEKRYGEEEDALRSTLAAAGFAKDAKVAAVGGGREWRDMMVKLAELYESQGAAKHNQTAMHMSYELASAVKARYPGTWRAHLVEANVLYRAGRLEDAAKGFHEVLKLEPQSHAALNNIGAIYQQSDPPRLQEALPVYAVALALPAASGDPALHNSYGTLLCNYPERFSEAKESFKNSLAIDPTFKAAQDGLTWVESIM